MLIEGMSIARSAKWARKELQCKQRAAGEANAVEVKGAGKWSSDAGNKEKAEEQIKKPSKQQIKKQLKEMKKDAKSKGLPFDKATAKEQILLDFGEASRESNDDVNASESDVDDEDGGVALDQISGMSLQDPEEEDVIERKKQEKAERKAAKKAEKAAKKAAKLETSASNESVDSTTNRESKKRKRKQVVEPVTGEDGGEEQQSKKSKKTKKNVLVESDDAKLDALIAEQNRAREAAAATATDLVLGYGMEPTTSVGEDDVKKVKREKKAAKKARKAQEEDAIEKKAAKASQVESEASEARKEKKEQKKKNKEGKVVTDESMSQPPQQAKSAEQWNASSLGGGDARKDKFLRLLGAGKKSSSGDGSTAIGGQKSAVAGGKFDIERMQSDLERQFEAGTIRKHDGGSKRRGLGA